MSEVSRPTVCVGVLDGGAPPTFVDAHIRLLPANVQILSGVVAVRDGEGRPVGASCVARAAAWLADRGLGLHLGRRFRARAVTRFLKNRHVDAVLAEGGVVGALMQAACRRAGVPLVINFHGRDAYEYGLIERWRVGYQRAFATCAAVVADSTHMAEQLALLGAPEDKIHCSACGAETDRFRPTDPAANRPVFVGVGRFVEKKAPHLTLLAFRRALDACPEARLVMIGDGVLLPICRDLAAGLRVGGSVDFPGRRPHEDVARSMQTARAFVQHSVTASTGDSEGSPVAVLEAGASGLPVVATRHAGIPEAVIEGETGFLVDERDVEGMARHMVDLARDPALAGRLGAAAREHIAAEFSMEKSIGVLRDILAEAAGEGR